MIHADRKNGQTGFTLVEVIVVAVIVAALAGVAVPVYLGYVNSSRLNAATNTAGAVASFHASCKNAAGVLPPTLDADAEFVGGAVGVTLRCDFAPLGEGPEDATINIPQGIIVRHVGTAPAATSIRAEHTGNPGALSNPYSY